jgi:plastocyanin
MLFMKRILLIAAAGMLIVAATASAGGATKITIRHQLHHCHSWSVNNGSWKAVQDVRVTAGSAIVFQNNDVMPHRLVETSGPALKLPKAANMSHMGAYFALVFPKAGTYHFKTVAGDDYMKGVKTLGEDNVLTLTVRVA